MEKSQIVPVLKTIDGKQLIKVSEPIFRMGSDPTSNVILDESPHHLLQLIRKNESWSVFNLSQFTLLLNDKQVDLAELKEGDTIEIDRWKYTFHIASEEVGFSQDLWISFIDQIPLFIKDQNISNLAQSLLDLSIQVFHADGGSLFLEQHGTWNYPEVAPTVSQTAIKQCLDSQSVIFWNKDLDQHDLSQAQSVTRESIQGIMVAPLGIQSFMYLQISAQDSTSQFINSQIDHFKKLSLFLKSFLENHSEKTQLREQVEVLRQPQGMIYQSNKMKQLIDLSARASMMPVPVFIQGETGTGKEVLAKFIHNQSDRSDQPFVAINCGAIPESLIESELFGYVKGAFTGANDDRPGLFQSAEGGTVFLDELGELPLQSQVKLLRVLQEKVVVPVGSHQEISVDFRLISATHKNLKSAVKKGSFREDLLFRLNVLELVLPPLREREDDVILIAEHFLKVYANHYGMERVSLSKSAQKSLLTHSWPGNIRELENTIQRVLIQSSTTKLDASCFSFEESDNTLQTLKSHRENAEHIAVDNALSQAKGNITLAAKILDIDRKVLRDLMSKLEIEKSSYKEGEV